MESTPAGLAGGTDEFMMFIYKISPCTRLEAHDWSICPYAHARERCVRRSPLMYNYSAKACPTVKAGGVCALAESCPFSHNVYENGLHPSRYRTQMCLLGDRCNRKICFFAHSVEQLRSPTFVSPTASPRQPITMLAAPGQASQIATPVLQQGPVYVQYPVLHPSQQVVPFGYVSVPSVQSAMRSSAAPVLGYVPNAQALATSGRDHSQMSLLGQLGMQSVTIPVPGGFSVFGHTQASLPAGLPVSTAGVAPHLFARSTAL